MIFISEICSVKKTGYTYTWGREKVITHTDTLYIYIYKKVLYI